MDIIQAAYEGDIGLVTQYIKNKTPVNVTNEYDETALHSVLMGINEYPVSLEDRLGIISLLLAADIDVDAIDSKGRTALFIAATTNQYEAALQLLNNKADVNIENSENESALYTVLLLVNSDPDYSKMAQLLQRFGAKLPKDNYPELSLFYTPTVKSDPATTFGEYYPFDTSYLPTSP